MLFGFTPDELWVRGHGQNQNTEAEREKCWRCCLAEHQEDVRRVPYGSLSSTGSLSGEVEAVIERTGWQKGEEVVGSQVQYGAFHILLPLTCGSEYWEEAATDCRLFTSIRIHPTYHNKLRAIRQTLRRSVAENYRKRETKLKHIKEKTRSMYHQLRRLSNCWFWEMNGLSSAKFMSTSCKHELSSQRHSLIFADMHMQIFIDRDQSKHKLCTLGVKYIPVGCNRAERPSCIVGR